MKRAINAVSFCLNSWKAFSTQTHLMSVSLMKMKKKYFQRKWIIQDKKIILMFLIFHSLFKFEELHNDGTLFLLTHLTFLFISTFFHIGSPSPTSEMKSTYRSILHISTPPFATLHHHPTIKYQWWYQTTDKNIDIIAYIYII